MSPQFQILGLPYALFVGAMVAIYWTVPARARTTVLFLSSLLFYALRSPTHAVLILALAGLVFYVGQLVAGRRHLWLFATMLGLCVAVLAYFKYGRWLLFETRASEFLAKTVPLGISFFIFEFIHYLVDVYKGRISADKKPGLLSFLAFGLFFPTLLAGPIKRYQDFSPANRLTAQDAAYGLCRMLLGIAKKVLLADNAAEIAMRLAIPDQVTPLGLWLAMYAYAVQIYFDFSGYSDLAIGTSRLLGYQIRENFNVPYISTSLPEFWRRWHISLSTWIRDYLFVPLGGSRRGPWRTVLNLLLVMALCGLWHGAAWHFVFFGLWHGLGLAVTHVFRHFVPPKKAAPPTRFARLFCGLLTFHFVCLGWIFFAAPSLSAALAAFMRMFGL